MIFISRAKNRNLGRLEEEKALGMATIQSVQSIICCYLLQRWFFCPKGATEGSRG